MTDYRLITMRRLIKYWGRRAEEQSGIMIVCMVMVFFFGLIFKSGSSLSAMLDGAIPYIIAMIGIGMTWLFSVTDMSDVAKISIWLGSTKKEMFAGQMLSSCIYIINIITLYIVTILITGKAHNVLYVSTGIGMVGALFIVEALSRISGIIRIRYGGQSDMYSFFVMMIITVMAGFAVVIIYGGYDKMINNICYSILCIGIIMYVICSAWYYKRLRSYDAR